jgi:hypothetical protein
MHAHHPQKKHADLALGEICMQFPFEEDGELVEHLLRVHWAEAFNGFGVVHQAKQTPLHLARDLQRVFLTRSVPECCPYNLLEDHGYLRSTHGSSGVSRARGLRALAAR